MLQPWSLEEGLETDGAATVERSCGSSLVKALTVFPAHRYLLRLLTQGILLS